MSFITIPVVLGNNTGLGYLSLANITSLSSGNTALGKSALFNMSAGTDNTAIGENALQNLGGNGGNTAVGKDAIKGGGAGNSSAFGAGGVLQNVNGTLNAAFGYGAGSLLANANKNSIFGSFSGNQGGLDIRNLSNYIVLSDGDGNPRLWINDTGAVNIPGGLGLTGSLTITGGTVTANNPVLSATQTWNNAAVTFTGWQLNVTDTASNAASLLMNLQVGGVTRFGVSKSGNGVLFGAGGVGAGNIAFGPMPTAENSVILRGFGSIFNLEAFSNVSVNVNSLMPFGWATSTYTTPDLQLWRDAANTLAQRNGVNAQTFRVYNTFTDASNYERGRFAWVSNVLTIGTENAGTGLARALELQTNGVTRIIVPATTGNVRINGSLGINRDVGVGPLDMVGASIRMTNGATIFVAEAGASLSYTGTASNTNFAIYSNSVQRALFDTSANVVINTAAIATNATDGFLYVPGCAGTPTGTPTTYTGRVPIVVDTTNNKLYFYSGGAWRDAGP